MKKNKNSVLTEDIDLNVLKHLKNIAESDMKEVAGEKQISEDSSVEIKLKETVLELAQTLNKSQFFEKIHELGLPKSSTLVKAVEPLLKK